MDRSRVESLEESPPSRSAEGAAPASANTCSNVPLDNGRSVAGETTPNPLSYWPPPSLPSMNFFKEAGGDPRTEAAEREPPCAGEMPKSSGADESSVIAEGSGAAPERERVASAAGGECPSGLGAGRPTRTLHHNLPPIAGITSSRNYRGAREIQRHSQQTNSVDLTSRPAASEKLASNENRPTAYLSRTEGEESAETKSASEPRREPQRERYPVDSSRDCDDEVVEVSPSPSLEKAKNANSTGLLSISGTFQKAAAAAAASPSSSSSRAQTPFVQTSAINLAGSLEEPVTQVINSSCSSFFAGSPSSSSRASVSPHFVPPLTVSVPSSVPCGTVQSASSSSSSSESSRMLTSSHSNLSSTSASNRAFSSHLKMSSFGEGSRPPPSLQAMDFHSNSIQRVASSFSSAVNSQTKLASANGSTLNNLPLQSVHSDSGRSRFVNESGEGDKSLKDFPRQNLNLNLNPRLELSHSNHSPINSNVPQQPNQPADGQSRKDPFESPSSKPYLQSYSHHELHHLQQHQQQPHHHHQPQQQQKQRYTTFGNYSNIVKPTHSSPKSLSPVANEVHRPFKSNIYPTNLKQANPRVSHRELDKHCDETINHTMNSQPRNSLGKEFHSVEYSQSEGSAQLGTANLSHNDVHQRNHSKETEMIGFKSSSAGVGGDGSWKNSGSGAEYGNKVGYANSNKNLKNEVNGNEYSGRTISDGGHHQDSVRHGYQTSESLMRSHFKLTADKKKICGFNPASQGNSLGLRFPPVPQSNYDLNRQIYDSMTGGSRLTPPSQPQPQPRPPPPLTGPLQKSSQQQFNCSKEQINVPTTTFNKCQPYYRDFSEQDRARSLAQVSSMKHVEYSSPGKNSGRPNRDFRPNSYGQFQGSVVEGQRQSTSQLCATSGFSLQPGDPRIPQPKPVLDHQHVRPSNSALNSGRQALPQTSNLSGVLPDPRNAPRTPEKHGPSLLARAPEQDVAAEYAAAGKKLMDDKLRSGPVQFAGSSQNGQNLIPSSQLKGKVVPSATVPARPKRESPLDLSVKTVRQSADSTAKDDGDTYFQNYRNSLHGNQPPSYSEGRFPGGGGQLNDASSSPSSSAGAPKIDFTPNFSDFHIENSRPTTPSHHHKSDLSVLPPVESFKKFSGNLIVPATTTHGAKGKGEFFAPARVNAKKAQSPARLANFEADRWKAESQKRFSDEFIGSDSPQGKIPKIDSWKVAFDQQIEQRLNSARITFQTNQNASNGVDATTSSESASQESLMYGNCGSTGRYRGASIYPQTPVQTSAAPYNPAYNVRQPQCQPATPQTPQEKLKQLENVGNSPDPEQIIKQISKGVMPDYKLLQDKNVLSILRSSLEEKEAKLMQLREAARRRGKCKESTPSEAARKSFEPLETPSKGQSHGKQSLPPFGAMALERMCAPPSFPGHKLNLPRSIDAVKIDVEPVQKYFCSRVKGEAEKSGIPSADPSPQDDAQGPPTDLDGLAAFLAARIRTKGELKQVGPAVVDVEKSASSQHSVRGQSGSVTSSEESSDRSLSLFHHHNLKSPNFASGGNPPKLVRESRLMTPLRRRLFSSHSAAEEEAPTTSSGQSNVECSSLPPRDPNGIRSSSETSVFDFRESDSEGEMPVLERQTLEEMRRDRKIFGSKQNVSTTALSDEATETDKPEAIAELDRNHSDPFWDTAFDMFVEQLEKRPPKRSNRKKKNCSRTSLAGSETDLSNESSKVTSNVEKSAISVSSGEGNPEEKAKNPDEHVAIEVKKEAEESEVKAGTVLDGHVKLSSSRLKSYRDDMMRNDRMKEMKLGKDSEKSNGNRIIENSAEDSEVAKAEKPRTKKEPVENKREVEKAKKGNFGIKTRGKWKNLKKETEMPDFESDGDERDLRSESESTVDDDDDDDDDDSLSLSGLESESSDSETSQESSSSSYTSYDDSESEGGFKRRRRMQTRLQTRSSRQKQARGTAMRLRSKAAVPLPATTPKSGKKRKKKKDEQYSCGTKRKKPSFGDGSHFRPGWEEECYKFKQQLRMPEKLISISRPRKRSSVSLPDLDPYRNSPSLDSSDVPVSEKPPPRPEKPNGDSEESNDSDSRNGKLKSQPASSPTTENLATSLLKSRNGKKSQSGSILNVLVKKYGKASSKKEKESKGANERKSPRTLPRGNNKPELLPTPSFGVGKENVLNNKKRSKEVGRKKAEEPDSLYLNYFRKKTVNKFKDAFKHQVGSLLSQELNPAALKSRTRTQTKRATLIEVFGEERAASAPPLSREEDGTDQEKLEKPCNEKKKPKMVKKACGGVVTRGRGKLMRSGRPGLRSTAVLRSNKAVQISKRHLNSGRKRNLDLLRMRAMAPKKFSYHLVSSADASQGLPITKKRLKLRSVRRKFRSGFDYIRKKKKLKKDGDSVEGSVKERKLPSRPTSESVEDVQNEIKNWVINKGLGETILHRAARLGYTDAAAYCLEKMDCSPSPRDNAGYTPLHEACSRGHLEIAKLLLMYGASVSESAKGGIRPLHEAAENGFTELIRLLLSFGADPLLETYTGHTALSLVTDEEARRLMQHHLADVQGNVAPTWTFQGPASLFDPLDGGCDPLCDPPSPGPTASECELEISDAMLPALYRLTADGDSDRRWILMGDLVSHTGAESKEALLGELDAASVRQMKLSDFREQAKSCDLLGSEKPPTKSSEVLLVAYDDRVRRLLNVERVTVQGSSVTSSTDGNIFCDRKRKGESAEATKN